jgi:phosphopantetheine adenylyltransferase
MLPGHRNLFFPRLGKAFDFVRIMRSIGAFLQVLLPGVVIAVILALLIWVLYRLWTARVLSADDLLAPGEEKDGTANALFAGSFNPPHEGHVTLLRAMARQHRGWKMFVVVGHNPKKSYPVSPAERVGLLRKICASDPSLSNVVPVAVDGYIWRFALAQRAGRLGDGRAASEACVMYRGIRSMAKDGSEERFLHVLNLLGPLLLAAAMPPPTVFVTPPTGTAAAAFGTDLTTLSSSKVRALVKAKKSIAGLVPAAIEDAVTYLYSKEAP